MLLIYLFLITREDSIHYYIIDVSAILVSLTHD